MVVIVDDVYFNNYYSDPNVNHMHMCSELGGNFLKNNLIEFAVVKKYDESSTLIIYFSSNSPPLVHTVFILLFVCYYFYSFKRAICFTKT